MTAPQAEQRMKVRVRFSVGYAFLRRVGRSFLFATWLRSKSVAGGSAFGSLRAASPSSKESAAAGHIVVSLGLTTPVGLGADARCTVLERFMSPPE